MAPQRLCADTTSLLSRKELLDDDDTNANCISFCESVAGARCCHLDRKTKYCGAYALPTLGISSVKSDRAGYCTSPSFPIGDQTEPPPSTQVATKSTALGHETTTAVPKIKAADPGASDGTSDGGGDQDTSSSGFDAAIIGLVVVVVIVGVAFLAVGLYQHHQRKNDPLYIQALHSDDRLAYDDPFGDKAKKKRAASFKSSNPNVVLARTPGEVGVLATCARMSCCRSCLKWRGVFPCTCCNLCLNHVTRCWRMPRAPGACTVTRTHA